MISVDLTDLIELEYSGPRRGRPDQVGGSMPRSAGLFSQLMTRQPPVNIAYTNDQFLRVRQRINSIKGPWGDLVRSQLADNNWEIVSKVSKMSINGNKIRIGSVLLEPRNSLVLDSGLVHEAVHKIDKAAKQYAKVASFLESRYGVEDFADLISKTRRNPSLKFYVDALSVADVKSELNASRASLSFLKQEWRSKRSSLNPVNEAMEKELASLKRTFVDASKLREAVGLSAIKLTRTEAISIKNIIKLI